MPCDRDPFEAELASFRPQPVSLELRERVGAEITRRPIRWLGVLAGLAAAACAVIGFALWHRGQATVSYPAPQVLQTQADVSPSIINYQRAFARSSESFDALLARPARREKAVKPTGVVRAFSRRDFDLNLSNGD